MIHIIGAYGKRYTSAEVVRKDWLADKDFYMLPERKYINRSDWLKYNKRRDSIIYCDPKVALVVETGIFG